MKVAKGLALQYMLQTVSQLSEHSQERGSEQLWSDRYTQATSEIYGSPEQSTAIRLASEQMTSLIDSATEAGINKDLVVYFEQQYQDFGIARDLERNSDKTEVVAREIGQYLTSKYAAVYETLLDGLDEHTKIGPSELAQRFEGALQVLSEQYDSDWADWRVAEDSEKDQLSVPASKKTINIGMRRASVTSLELKKLFSHEILVHAQRGLNGRKIDEQLGSGLLGYLDAEEGLGVFFEYAVSGEVPEKNIDRYVDVALAMGLIDSKPKPRQQMLDFAKTRAMIRNELKPEADRVSADDLEKQVYAHINRIYRGSLGNECIGIFTKDIVYQVGFMKIKAFLQSEVGSGNSIDDIITYLLRGKFDPTNELHKKYIESLPK